MHAATALVLRSFVFSVECSQIREISSNASLLPDENIEYSTYYSQLSNMDVWCAEHSDLSPNIKLIFTEPVYLLSAVFRGRNSILNYYVTNFSLIYQNPSNENMIYTGVDGNSVRNFIYADLLTIICVF